VYSDILACSNYRIIYTMEMIVLFIEAGRNRSHCCFEIIGFINPVRWWNETRKWKSGKATAVYMCVQSSCMRNWWSLVFRFEPAVCTCSCDHCTGPLTKGTRVQHSLIRVICDRHCYLHYSEFLPFMAPYIVVPFSLTVNSPSEMGNGMFKRTGLAIVLCRFEYP
jgi:hypothetical protein